MFKIASVSGAPPQTPVGKLTTLPDPLVVRGFLPSAIAASRLWRLQFSDSHVYTRKTQTFSSPQSPPPRNLQRLDFFTSNMSHYLKSLKICPGRSTLKVEKRCCNGRLIMSRFARRDNAIKLRL